MGSITSTDTNPANSRETHNDSITAKLTAREDEVLRLVTLGMSNKEISTALAISERTAKFHVGNLLAKFSVTTRFELLALIPRLLRRR